MGRLFSRVVVLDEGMPLEQRLGETPVQLRPTLNHSGTTTAFWKSSASLPRRWCVVVCYVSPRVGKKPRFFRKSFLFRFVGFLKVFKGFLKRFLRLFLGFF